mmetsp:Transcript_15871/g.37652  ORF Transcript_15871/g.37652 Transcript_15871/m.37652 type:complete len:200 (+) Transcript_15871:97-696(+)
MVRNQGHDPKLERFNRHSLRQRRRLQVHQGEGVAAGRIPLRLLRGPVLVLRAGRDGAKALVNLDIGSALRWYSFTARMRHSDQLHLAGRLPRPEAIPRPRVGLSSNIDPDRPAHNASVWDDGHLGREPLGCGCNGRGWIGGLGRDIPQSVLSHLPRCEVRVENRPPLGKNTEDIPRPDRRAARSQQCQQGPAIKDPWSC